MDRLTPEERSRQMGRIRSKNTKVEMTVRRLVFAMGYRYRLHRADLPGRPDMVFPVRRKIIFTHGCFWHRHEGCKLAPLPKSRLDFWQTKFETNRKRDIRTQMSLHEQGWRVLVIWECELKDLEGLRRRVRIFLEAGD